MVAVDAYVSVVVEMCAQVRRRRGCCGWNDCGFLGGDGWRCSSGGDGRGDADADVQGVVVHLRLLEHDGAGGDAWWVLRERAGCGITERRRRRRRRRRRTPQRKRGNCREVEYDEIHRNKGRGWKKKKDKNGGGECRATPWREGIRDTHTHRRRQQQIGLTPAGGGPTQQKSGSNADSEIASAPVKAAATRARYEIAGPDSGQRAAAGATGSGAVKLGDTDSRRRPQRCGWDADRRCAVAAAARSR